MLVLLSMLACTVDDTPQDYLSWFDPGSALDVTEPIAFTDEPYGFPADADAGVGHLEDELAVLANGGEIFS